MRITDLREEFRRNWVNLTGKGDGCLTDEIVSNINVHWLQYSPPPNLNFTILAVLYVIIMVIGIFGNAVVIIMFLNYKPLRTAPNFLVVNLGVSDFLTMIKMPILIYNACYSCPVLGNFACTAYAFLGGLSGTASISTLAAISYVRYAAIKYPLRRFSNAKIYICIALSWVNALIFSTAPLLNLGLDKYQYEGYLITCSFAYLTEDYSTKIYILTFFVAAFVVPTVVIAFGYYKIVKVVFARSQADFKDRDSIRFIKEEQKRKQETKLAFTILIVIFLWLFSWTPYAIVALLGIFNQKHLITPLVSMVPALFCKTASAIDPYIYAISHPKFRERLCRLIGKNTPKNLSVISHRQTVTLDHTIDEGVEIEIVELKFVRRVEKGDNRRLSTINESEFDSNVRLQIRKQLYKASLLGLTPSFTNRTSSLRKLTRRMSSARSLQVSDDENETEI